MPRVPGAVWAIRDVTSNGRPHNKPVPLIRIPEPLDDSTPPYRTP
ncbi:hypothetical protein [Streptomyces sp. NPDC053427]